MVFDLGSGMAVRVAVLCVLLPTHLSIQSNKSAETDDIPGNWDTTLGSTITDSDTNWESPKRPVYLIPDPIHHPQMVRPFMAPLVALELSRYPHARCVDGTPGGYYILPGDPKLFMIHLTGGGGCINLLSCRLKTFSPQGSSKNWPLYHSFRQPGTLLNTDFPANPHFGMATMVMVPYCSADLWSGTTTEPSKKTFNFWFCGHHIVNAVIDELMRKRGLKDAELLVFSGGADGGLGVTLHLDHVAERVAKAGSKVRVVGAPIGGFSGLVNLLVKPYTGPYATAFVRSDAAVLPTYAYQWNSVGPKACVDLQKKGDEWKCLLPAFILTSMKRPLFLFQAQTDSVHLPKYYGLPTSYAHIPDAVGGLPTQDPNIDSPMREWLKNYVALTRSEMRILMGKASGTVGFFMPACWTHTYFEEVKVNNLTYPEALVNFIAHPTNMIMEDGCGLFCNPTCKDPEVIAAYNAPQLP